MKKVLILFLSLSFYACENETKHFALHLACVSEITYDETELSCYLDNNIDNACQVYQMGVVESVIVNYQFGFSEFTYPNGFFIARFRNDTSMREVRFGEFMNNQVLKNFYLIRLTKDSIIVETGYNVWPGYEE